MERRDYLMREIQKVGIFLRKAISRMLDANDDGLENEMESIVNDMQNELQLSVDEILNISQEEFSEKLSQNKGFNDENIELLADLLVEISFGVVDFKTYNTKALEIYEYLNKRSGIFSMERAAKISRLKEGQ